MNSQEQAKTLLRKIIEEHWISIEGLEVLTAYVAPNYVHHRPAGGDTDFQGFRQERPSCSGPSLTCDAQ